MSIGLLLLRLALGAALLLQGTAKLRPAGRRDTAAYFAQLGIVPALPFALLAGVTEVTVGLQLVDGFGTVLAAAGATAVLGIAVAVTRQNGYWNASGGSEYPLLAGFTAGALMFTGAGHHSVDRLFGWSTPSTASTAAAIVLAIVSSAPVLVLRSRRLRRTRPLEAEPVGQVAS